MNNQVRYFLKWATGASLIAIPASIVWAITNNFYASCVALPASYITVACCVEAFRHRN